MRHIFGEELRLRTLRGLKLISKSVGSTMGVNGGNTVFNFSDQHFGVTKDGATVAATFTITRDNVAQAMSTMVKDVSKQTNDIAGDGTTTATVLASIMYEMGLKATGNYPKSNNLKGLLPEGYINYTKPHQSVDFEAYETLELDPKSYSTKTNYTVREYSDILGKYAEKAVEYLTNLETKVKLTPMEVVHHVALTSGNGDYRMADVFAQAFEKIGERGTVLTRTSFTEKEDKVTLIEGYQFAGDVFHQVYLNPSTMSNEFENPLIFLTDETVSRVEDIINVLKLSKQTGRPFLLVCSHIDDYIQSRLVTSMIEEGIVGAVVKAPRFGEVRDMYMEDIAILTGGKYLARHNLRVKDAKLEHTGSVDKVVIDLRGTKLIGYHGKPEDIADRIELLKNFDGDDVLKRQRDIDERIRKIEGRFAEIIYKVDSEVEQKEVEFRLADSLQAIHGALEEGVLPGGGIALLLCAKELNSLPEFEEIAPYMQRAFEEPFRVLMTNSELDPQVYLDKVYDELSEDNMVGVELKTMQITNMVKANVLDPLKVTKAAVTSAASVVRTIIQTKQHIANE